MDQFENTPNFPAFLNSTNSQQFKTELNSTENVFSLSKKEDEETARNRKGIFVFSFFNKFKDSKDILRKITFNADNFFTCVNPDHPECFTQKNLFNLGNFSEGGLLKSDKLGCRPQVAFLNTRTLVEEENKYDGDENDE